MKKEMFEEKMAHYYNALKKEFGEANVRVAQTANLDWRNKLFLIRRSTVHDSMSDTTALIIRVHLKNNKPGNEIWGVTSFFNYPHLSLDDEREIVTTAGEILEKINPDNFVICETGNVKVAITNVVPLPEIFGQKTTHVV